jgi:hypothetical protein|tara:strand:- start:36 stop:227 length:192 start_codon:yes stop_codon:yes gene_type:complete
VNASTKAVVFAVLDVYLLFFLRLLRKMIEPEDSFKIATENKTSNVSAKREKNKVLARKLLLKL